MRFPKSERQQAEPKAKVIVAEINGELIAFVVDKERPIVRIAIGEVDPPQAARG
jgi:chemotaxis signal transduction protein